METYRKPPALRGRWVAAAAVSLLALTSPIMAGSGRPPSPARGHATYGYPAQGSHGSHASHGAHAKHGHGKKGHRKGHGPHGHHGHRGHHGHHGHHADHYRYVAPTTYPAYVVGATFQVPVRMAYHERYRPYYQGTVFYAAHDHAHVVYGFPVQTSAGYVVRPHAYCNGTLFVERPAPYAGGQPTGHLTVSIRF